MSRLAFDLVREGWITSLARDGTPRTLGIRDTLTEAHDLAELTGDPPVVASLTRLLLAVADRVLDGPKTEAAWAEAWSAGRFEEKAVDAYLTKRRSSFDLFSADRPFFQAPLPEAATRSPAALDPAAALGHNATLFDHSMDARPLPMPAAEAARRLVALQAFAAGGLMGGEHGGRVSGKAAPLSGAWVFFVAGPSLFHTLLLNMPLYDPVAEFPFPTLGEDAPVWERTLSPNAAVRSPAGWLDLLTYPSRRVRLLGEESDVGTPLVTGVAVTDGDRADEGWSAWGREPATAFREATTGWVVLRPSENRNLWRDAATLFVTQSATTARPGIIDHAASLVLAGAIPDDVRLGLEGFALATNQARYLFWRHERLPLRASLFHSDETGERIAEAVDAATKVASALERAVAELAGRPSAPGLDPDERRRRRAWAQNAMGEYWAPLTAGFDRFLTDLANGSNAFANWSRCLEGSLRSAWSSWSATVSGTPAGLRRMATADRHFGGAVVAARLIGWEAA